MEQFSARPIRIADSTAFALTTGIEPGRPRQVGQVWELGSPPNVAGQPQNILVFVFSSTWTSSPIAGSYDARASSKESSSAVVIAPPPCPACRDRATGRPTA